MTGSGKIAKDFFQRAMWKKQRTKNAFSCIERRNRLQTRTVGKKMAGQPHGEDCVVLTTKFKLGIRKYLYIVMS